METNNKTQMVLGRVEKLKFLKKKMFFSFLGL